MVIGAIDTRFIIEESMIYMTNRAHIIKKVEYFISPHHSNCCNAEIEGSGDYIECIGPK